MHYSGKIGNGTRPIDELLWSSVTPKERNRRQLWALLRQALGFEAIDGQWNRVRRKIGERATRAEKRRE
jgi:hypothetical protein